MQNIRRALNKDKIQWNTTIFMIIFHLGTLCALYFFSWKWLAISILLNWIGGSLGIGIGFHRLMTHRGFQTPKIVEYFLAVCGTFALQGGPINSVVTHRIHHAFTEGPNDPHSPRDGKWGAHMEWILRGTAQQHSEKVMRRYAPDLMKDPVHVWINRLYFVPLTVSGIVLFLIGGLPAVLWGAFLRVTLGLHATWLVNSATHIWGNRRFATSDDSTNNWWVGLLTFGEGWHNNHHAYPTAARHGLKWYEIDINWWGITALKMMGLAKSIKLVSKEQIDASDEYGALRKVA